MASECEQKLASFHLFSDIQKGLSVLFPGLDGCFIVKLLCVEEDDGVFAVPENERFRFLGIVDDSGSSKLLHP